MLKQYSVILLPCYYTNLTNKPHFLNLDISICTTCASTVLHCNHKIKNEGWFTMFCAD